MSISPPWQQPSTIYLSQRIFDSFQHWLHRPLIEVAGPSDELAQTLFEAPFALMAHGAETDPVFNYGNRMALERFGMDWETFTTLPSRYSAEPIAQEERNRLLRASQDKGVIINFQAIRVTRSGDRFRIEDGILWNVLDEQGEYCGQAAIYSQWTPLPASKAE